MVKWDSYYFLVLYIPALYVLYILATWSTCTPISEIDSYRHLLNGDQIPQDATCFLDNHMTSISFYSYPPLEDNLPIVVGLGVLLAALAVLLVRPTLRLASTRVLRSLFHH